MGPGLRRAAAVCGLWAAAIGGGAAEGRAEDAADATPKAAEVVLRGKRDLTAALVAALRAAPRGTERVPGSVLLVVDPTPYVRASEDDLVVAIQGAGRDLPGVRTWRVARLGSDATGPLDSAGAALEAVAALRPGAPVANTFEALRRTARSFPDRGGRIVYLADWSFEDDHDADALADSLIARAQSFAVVGSEAAFSRAWNDGLDPRATAVRTSGGDPSIGRSPFGRARPEAPWHGGDTAWPAHPGYWNGQPWRSDFAPERTPERLEDLRERLGARSPAEEPDRPHPLPSAFGPWALQRTCGRTGGRYVLWSWNRAGRSDVTYDFARCDLLAPDLRSRAEILDDVARRPLPRAIVTAWNLVANSRSGVAAVTPPLSATFEPLEMRHVGGDVAAGLAWGDAAQLRAYLRGAPESLARIDEAISALTRAIDRTPSPPGPADLRDLADAHLFRHVLRVQRFSLGAALETARTIPESWFRRDGSWVALRPVPWEGPEGGPEPGRTTDRPYDASLAHVVAEDRAAMLRRYAGTPFGETVSRNRIYVWEPVVARSGPASTDPSRSPGQSGAPPSPPTPGGSGGGGAAPTGR